MRHTLRRILMTLTLALLLTGCETVTDWHSRYVFGLDCRDESLKDGHCVKTR